MTTRFLSFLFIACCVLFAGTSLEAQRLGIGGFKLKKIGGSFGQDQDMLGDMSANYFISTAQEGELERDYSQLNLDPSYVSSMICENPHLRLNLTWEHEQLSNLEFGTNLVLITGRIDEMSFRTPDYENHLRISQYSNEIVFEPTLGWRLGHGAFNLTGIIGGNLGYHWGDMSLYGDVTDCGDGIKLRSGDDLNGCESIRVYENAAISTGISTRLFAEAKASFQIARRLEMGLHIRRGAGLRLAGGTRTQTTTLHSGGVSMAWVLR